MMHVHMWFMYVCVWFVPCVVESVCCIYYIYIDDMMSEIIVFGVVFSMLSSSWMSLWSVGEQVIDYNQIVSVYYIYMYVRVLYTYVYKYIYTENVYVCNFICQIQRVVVTQRD